MHIGLNMIFVVPTETGGMETYARELVARLPRALPDARLTAFVARESAGTWPVDEIVVPVHARDRKQWVFGEQWHLPRMAHAAGCDLVHSLASTAPLHGRFARVVTIHDLLYRNLPEAHFGLRARGMAALVPLAARRSDRVIAISETTAADVRAHLPVRAGCVDVVPQGVAPPRVPATPEADLRRRLGLADRRVVLTTGGTRPHKNVARLAEAVDGLDAVLVVTGYATPEDAALPAHVVRTGHVTAEDVEGLYALAAVACSPSLAEGFGLPVLEAMIRGVPVACSVGGALGEIAGDAALTFDPLSVEQIREALRALLDDGGRREHLIAAGRQRAAQFTWEQTAELTVASYRAALSLR